MEIRGMRGDERAEVLGLLEAAFGEREVFEGYMDFDPAFSPGDFLVADAAGRLVSCVQVFEKRIRLGEGEVRLGGIGSVATLPECRGRGLASALMQQAHLEMGRRGMPIALLFTGRFGFYEPLGWRRVAERVFSIRFETRAEPDGVRDFRPDDLPSVREIYDRYNARRVGTTVRDEVYWKGQLHYAGAPQERFRVATRGSRVVAYARAVRLGGGEALMEYGRLADASEAAAAAIRSLCDRGDLRGRETRDPELHRALESSGASVRSGTKLQGSMWRVIDAAELARCTGSSVEGDDELIGALIEREPAHYWLSDRF